MFAVIIATIMIQKMPMILMVISVQIMFPH